MTKPKIEYVHKKNSDEMDAGIQSTLCCVAETIDNIFERDLNRKVEFFLVIKTAVNKDEEGLGIISNNRNKDNIIEILRSRLDYLESQFKQANNELN